MNKDDIDPLQMAITHVVIRPVIVTYGLINTLFPHIFNYMQEVIYNRVEESHGEDIPSDSDAYDLFKNIFGGIDRNGDNADQCWAVMARIVIAKALAGEEIEAPPIIKKGDLNG